MSSDDRRQEAIKQEIGLLLQEYAGLEREGAYVGEWTISPTGQPWPMTWGVLLAGLETEKAGIRDEGP